MFLNHQHALFDMLSPLQRIGIHRLHQPTFPSFLPPSLGQILFDNPSPEVPTFPNVRAPEARCSHQIDGRCSSYYRCLEMHAHLRPSELVRTEEDNGRHMTMMRNPEFGFSYSTQHSHQHLTTTTTTQPMGRLRPPPANHWSMVESSGSIPFPSASHGSGREHRRGGPSGPHKARPDKRIFGCRICSYVTDRKNNLKRHVMAMHQKSERILECCGLAFDSKAALRDHATRRHDNGYACLYCRRNFCRKALLRRHLAVHDGRKDYACADCGYATSHKSNLERHRKVHQSVQLQNWVATDDFLTTTPPEDKDEKEDGSRYFNSSSTKMIHIQNDAGKSNNHSNDDDDDDDNEYIDVVF